MDSRSVEGGGHSEGRERYERDDGEEGGECSAGLGQGDRAPGAASNMNESTYDAIFGRQAYVRQQMMPRQTQGAGSKGDWCTGGGQVVDVEERPVGDEVLEEEKQACSGASQELQAMRVETQRAPPPRAESSLLLYTIATPVVYDQPASGRARAC